MRVATAPGIGAVDAPYSVATPESSEPQRSFGVESNVTDSVSGAIATAEPPVKVEEPAPTTEVVEPRTAESRIGPRFEGQLRTAVGVKHNCGASPTAVMVADAASLPFRVPKFTTNFGLCPESATGRLERSTAFVSSKFGVEGSSTSGTAIFTQPGTSTPCSVKTVSVAPEKLAGPLS